MAVNALELRQVLERTLRALDLYLAVAERSRPRICEDSRSIVWAAACGEGR